MHGAGRRFHHPQPALAVHDFARERHAARAVQPEASGYLAGHSAGGVTGATPAEASPTSPDRDARCGCPRAYPLAVEAGHQRLGSMLPLGDQEITSVGGAAIGEARAGHQQHGIRELADLATADSGDGHTRTRRVRSPLREASSTARTRATSTPRHDDTAPHATRDGRRGHSGGSRRKTDRGQASADVRNHCRFHAGAGRIRSSVHQHPPVRSRTLKVGIFSVNGGGDCPLSGRY